METKHGIYRIKNINNGKEYVGSSIDVFKRRNRHFSELNKNKHKNKKLQASFNKYGKEVFEFYVLELVENKELLIEREQFHINERKPWFNINLIANSSLGVKRSDETKEKLRKQNSGLKHPEWRNKIKSEAQGGDNHWTKKKGFSDDARKKMSETHKNLFKNGYKHPRKGVKENFEEIENKKLRASKPVQQFTLSGELVNEFTSAKEAKKFGFHPIYIGQCCNFKRKKYKNYVWKFKE